MRCRMCAEVWRENHWCDSPFSPDIQSSDSPRGSDFRVVGKCIRNPRIGLSVASPDHGKLSRLSLDHIEKSL